MQCIHHLPGRLRVRVASIKGNAQRASTLGYLLTEIEGVRSVAANPLTGSVLVYYDPATLSVGTLMAQIPASEKHPRCSTPIRKHAVESKSLSRALGQAAVQRIAAAVAKHILEAALERAIMALIASIL
jgi:hypothetical protein